MSDYRILVIDDDPAQHDILGEYLALYGFDVVHAYNGREGIERIAERAPDLVLLDVNMPEKDGFETVAEIREDPRLDMVPVLFLTSLDRSNLKVKGLESGADDFITKPYDKAELLARVRTALRRTDRYRKAVSDLMGDLGRIGLAEVLQTLQIGMKSAVVVLEDLAAVIHIERGNLVHAEMAGFTGMEALRRVFYLERGGFKVDFGEPPKSPRELEAPLDSVILDVMTHIDEVNRLFDKGAGPDDTIRLGSGVGDRPALKAAEDRLPARARDIVAAMEGPLMDNARELNEAIASGALAVSNR